MTLADLLDSLPKELVEGLVQRDDGTLVPQYRTEPTAEQRQQVEAILAAADLRPRRLKTDAVIDQRIATLEQNRPARYRAGLRVMFREFLKTRPKLLRELGEDFDTDEIDK